MLSKEDILKAQDLPKEIVDIPEWNGQVEVRTQTAKERTQFLKSIRSITEENTIENLAIAFCVYDDKGNRFFSNEDSVLLGNQSAAVVTRLTQSINRLNALGLNDVKN